MAPRLKRGRRAAQKRQKKGAAGSRSAKVLVRKSKSGKPRAPSPRPSSLRDLRALVRQAETVTLLARRLRVHRSTIYRWLSEGLPKKVKPRKRAAKKKIERVKRRTAAERKKSREERAVFAELMKLAGEAGIMPKIRSGDRTRSGRRTQGHQWTRAFHRELSPEILEQILAWVKTIPGGYPLWQISAVTSQFALTSQTEFGGKHRKPDYKTIIVQLRHLRAGDFAVERVEPSNEGTRAEVLQDFKERMTRILASEALRVFIHGVTVFNYLRRTKREEREWATRERTKRFVLFERRKARGFVPRRKRRRTVWIRRKKKRRR